ncbi:MAG: hypothetical protein JXR96_14010 [Deltaproteobacteria bacterium]|nr:hypothetical protein [Deltaproteobacteria bacterium]
MVQTAALRAERVSGSMIRSVFGELKANGYSDGQIVALSNGLKDLAQKHMAPRRSRQPSEPEEACQPVEYDLSLLGLPCLTW